MLSLSTRRSRGLGYLSWVAWAFGLFLFLPRSVPFSSVFLYSLFRLSCPRSGSAFSRTIACVDGLYRPRSRWSARCSGRPTAILSLLMGAQRPDCNQYPERLSAALAARAWRCAFTRVALAAVVGRCRLPGHHPTSSLLLRSPGVRKLMIHPCCCDEPWPGVVLAVFLYQPGGHDRLAELTRAS